MSEWEPAVNIAVNVANKICRRSFDPHVVLKVFQYFPEKILLKNASTSRPQDALRNTVTQA